jgi:AIPR protein
MTTSPFSDLKKELQSIGDRSASQLREAELFVAWYLLATSIEDETTALATLTDTHNEGGVDAVHIDRSLGVVTLVQGKLRQSLMGKAESPKDLEYFFKWGELLLDSGPDDFKREVARLAPKVSEKLKEARKFLNRNSTARLTMHYASTGKFSRDAARHWETKATRLTRERGARVSYRLVNGNKVLQLFETWMRTAAPPVDEVELSILTEPIYVDLKTKGITTLLATVAGHEIGRIGIIHGKRIFARNIRGYLGIKTDVNRDMAATLRDDPDHFWLMNNGITIVCSDAKRIAERRECVYALSHPQIINGQQTTRTLGEAGAKAREARVLVRIIAVADDPATSHRAHEEMISSIVRATNHQSAVKASDLVVNDSRQIKLDRALKVLNYAYIRKRESRKESGGKLGRSEKTVKMVEIAAATGGCLESALPLRLGQERMFERDNYERIFDIPDVTVAICQVWLHRAVIELKRRGMGAIRTNGRSASMAWNRGSWVVLFTAWRHLSSDIRRWKRDLLPLFESKEVDGDDPRRELRLGLSAAFKAVELFYKDAREDDDEPNRFFKRKSTQSDFDRWWKSHGGPQRKAFRQHMAAFVRAIQPEE